MKYGDIEITGSLSAAVSGDSILLESSIVPSTSGTLSLGTSGAPFKELFVTENSIFMGDTKLSVSGGTLLVNGSEVQGGGGSTEGLQVISVDVTTDTSQPSTTSTSYVDSGLSVTVDPVSAGASIKIDVNGFGGNTDFSFVSGTLYRSINGGGDVDITPGAGDTLAMFGTVMFSMVLVDSSHGASDGDTIEYKIYWKTQAGTAYLGRTGSGTPAVNVPIVMTATQYL